MLRTRVLTALVLVSVFGALLFGAPGPAWTVFAAVVAALSAWEWTGLIRVTGPLRIVFASLLAVLVMILLFRLRIFSLLTVSIAGALAHNAGQLWVAATLLFRNPVLWYLLPYLLLTGVLTGVVTGVFSFWLLKRLEGDFEEGEK